jgi:lipid A ethanolaminephosphotransferase
MLAQVDTSSSLIHNEEALPSYLQRHGIDTIWVSSNWGEPPLKVQTYLRSSELRGSCKGDHCNFDEVLLTGLAQRIAGSSSDKVFVVLHQTGSHGPDYSDHYPPEMEKFTPVCRSVQLQECTPETLTNAYDNTILYEDHVLAEIIQMLRAIPGTATLMMYASDHGESLGEYGLYMHGTPYSMAPDVQKDIPYIVWMSETFKQHKALSADAALGRAQHAHQTIFHSVMGAFDMRSEIYNPQLDIFVDARSK